MPIDERARHELYLAIEALAGAERADTLMDLLPPVGWAEVATKGDLTALEERVGLRFAAIDLRFDAVDLRFDAVDARFDARFDALDARFDAKLEALGAKVDRALRDQTRSLIFGLVTAMAAMSSLCLAAIAFTR